MTKTFIRRAAPLLALFLLIPGPVLAQQPTTEYEGAAALGLELRRLGTTKRVLMIGAHPDDESTQILSTLALGQGAEVAYLALTRGEGGQNGIGPELQEGLGLLRTEELLAARRLDGAHQYFTRAYDFGFSKDAEETFRHWPREEILRDVVAVVRHFRPDVVLSVFSGTPRDGHGHHQVAGILAREAFEAAGDPNRFPELRAGGLSPFAPARFYHALWGQNSDAGVRLETGEMDPLLGRSYYQVAMASRSRHRSQDMGRPLTPGPQSSALELAMARGADTGARVSLFAGLDTTLSARAERAHASAAGEEEGATPTAALLREYEGRVEAIRQTVNPLRPAGIVDELAGALRTLRLALESFPTREAVRGADAEAREAEAALWRAAALELDALADDEAVTPGQTFEVTLSLWNGGADPVVVRRLEPVVPAGWAVAAEDPRPAGLAPGELLERRFRVSVPVDAATTRPYFLRAPRQGDLYSWAATAHLVGIPFEEPALRAVAEVEVAGVAVGSKIEAKYLEVDRRLGEIRRPVRVVPGASVLLTPGAAVVPLSDGGAHPTPLRVTATVRSEHPESSEGTLALEAPAGWQVEPRATTLRFARPGEERKAEFTVTPPAARPPGLSTLSARFVAADGRSYGEGFTLVDYPHVQPHPLYRDASIAVRAFPIAVPEGMEVGYVPGAGDDAPEALRQLGVRVTSLGAEELATGDLERFDAILTGIRAYEVNPALVANNRRLLDYARQGGTVVVQYSKYEYTDPGIAPYPVEMSRPHDRVTDEAAEVRLLEPRHQALSWPNRITAADFEGWHQERGLYFLSRWDERFTPLLEMADPGEEPSRGSLLVAPVGEGTYVYSGLAFFRQLPEGVPGAYRLLVNLLSLGKNP